MNSWIIPNKEALELEYYVEVELKGHKDWFPTSEAFLDACAVGEVTDLTADMNKKVAYRSNTKTKDQLLNLIRGYASYPEFRNEDTIDNLYERIGNDKSMNMPIVLDFGDDTYRVLCGNTRLDVAFQLGQIPKVLIVKVNK